jgi:hypothetical protein
MEAIPKTKTEDLLEIIRSVQECMKIVALDQHLQKNKNRTPLNWLSTEYTVLSNQSVSIADELRKLAKLKEEGGILTEEEFKQMKQDLIRKNHLE